MDYVTSLITACKLVLIWCFITPCTSSGRSCVWGVMDSPLESILIKYYTLKLTLVLCGCPSSVLNVKCLKLCYIDQFTRDVHLTVSLLCIYTLWYYSCGNCVNNWSFVNSAVCEKLLKMQMCIVIYTSCITASTMKTTPSFEIRSYIKGWVVSKGVPKTRTFALSQSGFLD